MFPQNFDDIKFPVEKEKKMTKNPKREKFLDAVYSLKDRDFWEWASSWLADSVVLDIIENWDDDIIDEYYQEFVEKGWIKEDE
jgi:hypothetical protein